VITTDRVVSWELARSNLTRAGEGVRLPAPVADAGRCTAAA